MHAPKITNIQNQLELKISNCLFLKGSKNVHDLVFLPFNVIMPLSYIARKIIQDLWYTITTHVIQKDHNFLLFEKCEH